MVNKLNRTHAFALIITVFLFSSAVFIAEFGFKINAPDEDNSTFSKQRTLSDDVLIPPRWTPLEQKYLPCLDRRCVCPYLNGTARGNDCLLQNGKLLQRGLRQELRALNDSVRKQFEETLNYIKSSGLYNRVALVHKYSAVHLGPAFLGWHREYLKRFELVIRRYLPDTNMGIPYWDSTLDSELPNPRDSIIFTDIFLGDVDKNGLVSTGPYANWTTMEGRHAISRKFGANPAGKLLSDDRVDWITKNPDMNMVLGSTMPLTTCKLADKLDARMLEYSHNYVHFYVGGDMGKSASSTNDVVFLYHHSMVDLIYESWRQTMLSRTQREKNYPSNEPNCFPPWHSIESIMPMLEPLTNREALSNGYTDEMYEFAPRPTCSQADLDCHSKYLFCHVPKNRNPRCMSKIRAGGNCEGFEGTKICYMAVCIRGVCRKEKPKKQEKDKVNRWFM